MVDESASEAEYRKLIEAYCTLLNKGLQERWDKMRKDLYANEQQEVISALIARQVTLATCLARGPNICNWHLGPLVLRTMIDAYITLAWILEDPEKRSRLFILYGLGQEKLQIEHLKASKSEDDPRIEQLINAREDWVNSQRYTFMTDVDIGAWSGISAREMAEQVGELNLYNFAYTPFSACGHNMWNHVGRFNLETCTNPLHKYHRIPTNPDFGSDFDVVMNSAKYLEKTFRKVDEKLGLTCSTVLPLDYWRAYFERTHADNKDAS